MTPASLAELRAKWSACLEDNCVHSDSDFALNAVPKLFTEVHRLDLALAEARADADKMRPVYIAAKAWRPHRHRDVVGTAPLGGQRTETGVALIDAVDEALAAEALEAK